LVTGKTVKPDGKCNTPCVSGDVCVVEISNRNTPFVLIETTGPIRETWQEFEPAGADPEFTQPPGRTFYFEVSPEMIEEDTPFSITVRRGGASQVELSGPNHKLKVFTGVVKKPKVFELHAVASTSKDLDSEANSIQQHYKQASTYLRENSPQQESSAPPPLNLKQRLSNVQDVSVSAEYKISSIDRLQFGAPSDYSTSLHFSLIQALNTSGYDILLTKSIDDFGAPCFGLTYSWLGFMILSREAPVKVRTALHELGHAVGLAHWEDDIVSYFNIMRENEIYGGPFEARALSVSPANPDEIPQSTAYWVGRGEW
jgi:hypothetical protein